jgi:hypothetical protein
MKTLISLFDSHFLNLHERSVEIVKNHRDAATLWRPFSSGGKSFGEYIVRSAAEVEQTFNGITTRLWDDPFEWTLPEQLINTDGILRYFEEVEKARKNGFAFFQTDDDLKREFPAPIELKTICTLLLETISRAENFQGRAIVAANLWLEPAENK